MVQKQINFGGGVSKSLDRQNQPSSQLVSGYLIVNQSNIKRESS